MLSEPQTIKKENGFTQMTLNYYKDIRDSSSSPNPAITAANATSCFLFTVDNACPDNHIVTFSVHSKDGGNKTFTDNFTITILP